jgi:hypothetical protein
MFHVIESQRLLEEHCKPNLRQYEGDIGYGPSQSDYNTWRLRSQHRHSVGYRLTL